MLELLSPAGNMEKLKTAFKFGADACYMAGKKFGLRTFSGNFDETELDDAVKYAHSLGKKIYITVNIVAHNSDFEGLDDYLIYLDKIGVDGIIVSDLGIMSIAKKLTPNLQIHVSTQANVTNKYTAKYLCDMGVKRLVLARELSIEEIKEIREFIPDDVEREKAIIVAQIKEDPKNANKPDAIIEKMVDGKINKFFEQNCLLQQEFVKDSEFKVEAYLASKGVKMTNFIRFEKGEGLQKKEENFADEVMKQIK